MFTPHVAIFNGLPRAFSGERLHPNGGMIWNGETDIQFARLQRERLACGHATH